MLAQSESMLCDLCWIICPVVFVVFTSCLNYSLRTHLKSSCLPELFTHTSQPLNHILQELDRWDGSRAGWYTVQSLQTLKRSGSGVKYYNYFKKAHWYLGLDWNHSYSSGVDRGVLGSCGYESEKHVILFQHPKRSQGKMFWHLQQITFIHSFDTVPY